MEVGRDYKETRVPRRTDEQRNRRTAEQMNRRTDEGAADLSKSVGITKR
jgi:hypothetical protein